MGKPICMYVAIFICEYFTVLGVFSYIKLSFNSYLYKTDHYYFNKLKQTLL